MTRIRLEEACVRDAKGRCLLSPLSLEVEPNETLVVCGASGAGKSLLIELIAGLRQPDEGRVLVDDTDVHRIAPNQRHVGLQTQDAALYDHLDVRANVAFGIRTNGLHGDSVDARVDAAARIAQCSDLLTRNATNVGLLSGGERRRVALAKALAIEGRILLLDEPLDGLDQVTRDAIRMRLRAKLRDRSGPTIIALHDRADAIALADRILLLDSGKSLQVDTPEGLIRSPATVRVAQLFADPSPTILIGRIDDGQILLPGGSIEYSGPLPASTMVDVVIPPHTGRIGESGLSGWHVHAHEPTSTGVDLLLAHETNAGADPQSLLRVAFGRDGDPPATGHAVLVELNGHPLLVFAQSQTKCDDGPPSVEN